MTKSRISKLEISDFRGLEGCREIDFEGADIVLLLGLNGFGKTSVFDAIEWGLTGKIGRYEQYTESGRKQDFGKEKEILRNKYAENPNTFAKITLDNGSTIGRRILSSGKEADYGLGSSIDGCLYGLESLTQESIRPELVNGYFSATHILSQETINHFVTSKKPEERYQALSVNFGTSVFSPFEGNVHKALARLDELSKETNSEITQTTRTISTLNSTLGSEERNISKVIIEANEQIDVLNNLTVSNFGKQVELNAGTVSVSVALEKKISKAKSLETLEHEESRRKLADLLYLEKNISSWSESNKDLVRYEKAFFSLVKDRKELDELQKQNSINDNELGEEIIKLERSVAVESRFSNALNEISNYIRTSKKIFSIEESISSRNKSLENAKKLAEKLEKDSEKSKREVNQVAELLNQFRKARSVIQENRPFLIRYKKDTESLIKNFVTEKDELKIKFSAIKKLRVFIDLFDKTDPRIVIGELLAHKNIPLEGVSDILDSLRAFALALESLDSKMDAGIIELKNILIEKERLEVTFSEMHQLLSAAIDQIDLEKEDQLCPVCETKHKSESLLAIIESKLGEKENNSLKLLNLEIARLKSSIDELTKEEKIHLRNLGPSLKELQKIAVDGLSQMVAAHEELRFSVEEKYVLIEEREEKYSNLIQLTKKHWPSKFVEYKDIFEHIDKKIDKNELKLSKLQTLAQEIESRVSENDLVLKGSLEFNSVSLAEIESLRDSKYLAMIEFLNQNGINSDPVLVEELLRRSHSGKAADKKKLEIKIQRLNKVTEKLAKQRRNVLANRTTDSILRETQKVEVKISNTKEILNNYLDYLSGLGMSVEQFNRREIARAKNDLNKTVEVCEARIVALDKLQRKVALLKSYNADKSLRNRLKESNEALVLLTEKNDSLVTIKDKFNRLKKSYPSVLKGMIRENMDVDLFNQIYELLNPHRRFKTIDFEIDVKNNKIGLNFNALQSKIRAKPEYLFSSAQLNTFGICMFLSMALRQSWLNLDSILIDDPIQNLDDINILSFIDFLRGLLDHKKTNKQIILSTHDDRFYDLMVKKFQGYNMKSFRFESYGKLSPDVGA